jgi:sterol desaturase/sphingolipid hydroxylase (fatty acid hydroxylase superfamily)
VQQRHVALEAFIDDCLGTTIPPSQRAPAPHSSCSLSIENAPSETIDPFYRSPRPPRRRVGGKAVSRCFVPFVLVSATVPWLFPEMLGRASQGAPVASNPMPFVLTMMMLIIWMAEQLYPENPSWNPRPITDGAKAWSRLGRDLFYVFGVSLVSAFLIQAIAQRLGSSIEGYGLGFGGARGVWPNQAPGAIRILGAFLLVEFGSYWLHRAAHRFDLLWRFHSTHHVIVELNALKAWRTHPIDNVFFYLIRTLPLMLLGVSLDEVVTVTCLGGILGIVSHANVKVSNPVLGLVVNLPSYHSVHHSSDPAESRLNFGCHTVLWDRIFGTFRRAPKLPLELGVYPVGRRSLWQELAWPFYHSMDASPSDSLAGSKPEP